MHGYFYGEGPVEVEDLETTWRTRRKEEWDMEHSFSFGWVLEWGRSGVDSIRRKEGGNMAGQQLVLTVVGLL